MRNILEKGWLKSAARITSLLCAIVCGSTIVHAGFTSLRIAHEREVAAYQQRLADEEEAREVRLEQERKDFENIVCATNIAVHEVLNQLPGVHETTIKVIVEMANDSAFKVGGDICKLATIPKLFSHLKNVTVIRSGDSGWPAMYNTVSQIYEDRARRLPRGMECVRAFRVSDEYLEKIGPIGRAALGITPDAPGLEWFDRTQVHVRTIGDIAYFRHRNGCAKPSPTA